MNDIWNTKDYNSDKAVKIAKKYKLDASMVEHSIRYGNTYSDNMIVYCDYYGDYCTVTLDEPNDKLLDDEILDKVLSLINYQEIEDTDAIECVVIRGNVCDMKLEVRVRIK